ncbi:KamA family radical SAM protein [Desulfohalobiaceae bacterium Ax17]|uniref:KamA family radical SAM protein n=1 Tax=Desulfovulcanus ferrireducens TaxID=2831190 RepID=UPI00207BAD98|nr:KamA family radical SAM protein [Desulfovulcanus ferrireducens]MBT8763696.1 KamA family radical SAM protein [Desulfovulcanus ferrireducens]
MSNLEVNDPSLDDYTKELFEELYAPGSAMGTVPDDLKKEVLSLLEVAQQKNLTTPIIKLFEILRKTKKEHGISPDEFGISKNDLLKLAKKHEQIDEHEVSIGGRVGRALPIVQAANSRIQEYLQVKDKEAPSGIELWPDIEKNIQKIKKVLGISDDDWNTFKGQLRYAIEDFETLAQILDLPEKAIKDIARVTKHYRMRLTPYYASLIMPGRINDPVLLQSVPTGEMVDNAGVEIPPVAADHSPARLIDQFYPRVVTIKATNICAMYCTHCLRIAHIGKKDRIYSKEAYREAFEYIKKNSFIRDVLITGGDSFVLPNEYIRWILNELDSIDHVKVKRLGTRIPVTTPQRIDTELLDILEESNDIKPIRVVTQINTAQEITPVSKEAFKQISKRVSAVLNQAVLLRGINDSKVKMWKLCETIHEAYVRPYYVFNCSYRNPQFIHLRVPIEKGRDIIESMYGNISGDAIPRYIATAGGKIPLHRSNVIGRDNNDLILKKPWSGEEVKYPDADANIYEDNDNFAFAKYNK